MTLGIAQLIYLALIFLSIGITLSNWGEPIDRNHGWIDIIATLIILGLLTWGGFFS